MAKKSPLNDIIEKKSRADRYEYAAWGELATLHAGFLSLINPEPYQASIHVIAIASCIEAFSKSCIKILIDHENSPYLERAKNFKDLSFDFDLTKALSKQEITFGDLISHNLSISSAEQIIKYFDTLFTGDNDYKNFKSCLAAVREFVEPPEEIIMNGSGSDDVELGDLILSNADETINHVQQIFAARHIAAHEANFRLVDSAQLHRWFESAMAFANATHEIIEQKIRPNAPREAFGSSVHALQNSAKLYSSIGNAWHALVHKWQTESNLDHFALEKLWLAIKESDEAFSNYIEKEITVNFQRTGTITGNGYRHLEAKIQKMNLASRVSYLKSLLAEP